MFYPFHGVCWGSTRGRIRNLAGIPGSFMEDCLITTFCPLCSFVQSANQLVEIEAERRRPTGGTQISIISPLQQQMAMAPAGINPMCPAPAGYGEFGAGPCGCEWAMPWRPTQQPELRVELELPRTGRRLDCCPCCVCHYSCHLKLTVPWHCNRLPAFSVILRRLWA
jgi:hypothetical protein